MSRYMVFGKVLDICCLLSYLFSQHRHDPGVLVHDAPMESSSDEAYDKVPSRSKEVQEVLQAIGVLPREAGLFLPGQAHRTSHFVTMVA